MIEPMDLSGLQEDEDHEHDAWAFKIHEKMNEIINYLNKKDDLKDKLFALINAWEKEAAEWQKKHEDLFMDPNVSQNKAAKASFMSYGILKCCKDLSEVLK